MLNVFYTQSRRKEAYGTVSLFWWTMGNVLEDKF